jgi:hypothetical protein
MTPRKLPNDLFFQVLRGYVENDNPFDETDPAVADGFHEVNDDELNRDPSSAPLPIDYAQLIHATRQVGNWLLDVARSHTNDPIDLASIERVQATMRANFAGTPPSRPGKASEEDILVVLGILITAFEVDFRVPGLGALAGSLYDAADGDLDVITRHLMDMVAGSAAHQRSSKVVQRANDRADSTRKPCTPRRVPIMVQRRPRTAHGADDLGRESLGSILIIR